MAIGTGAVFGLTIRENFRRPYLARSIQEFWQRWHLSLADFVFRYLFVTLARKTRGRVELSIFLSFVLIGLWHGATVGYLVWGVCHGLALVGAARYKQAARGRPAWDRLRRTRLHAAAGWALTMTLVAFLSTFANAGGLDASLVLVRHLLGWAVKRKEIFARLAWRLFASLAMLYAWPISRSRPVHRVSKLLTPPLIPPGAPRGRKALGLPLAGSGRGAGDKGFMPAGGR